MLIAHVSVRSIPLDSLRIIRGSQLYNSSYALAVHDNFHHGQAGSGLRELHLKRLTGMNWDSSHKKKRKEEDILRNVAGFCVLTNVLENIHIFINLFSITFICK